MAIDMGKTLRSVLEQLMSEKARVDRQIDALQVVLDGTVQVASPTRRRRRMSAAARRAIGQRMKAYWAKRRAMRKGAGERRTRAAGKRPVAAKSVARKVTATNRKAPRRTRTPKPAEKH